MVKNSHRIATVSRKTAETDIVLTLAVDGAGASSIETGVPFFDHMLTLFAKHGLFDLKVRAKGDLHIDFHHTTEDVGIALEWRGEGVEEQGICKATGALRVAVDPRYFRPTEVDLLIGDPSAIQNPFYRLFPDAWVLPAVVLAYPAILIVAPLARRGAAVGCGCGGVGFRADHPARADTNTGRAAARGCADRKRCRGAAGARAL